MATDMAGICNRVVSPTGRTQSTWGRTDIGKPTMKPTLLMVWPPMMTLTDSAWEINIPATSQMP